MIHYLHRHVYKSLNENPETSVKGCIPITAGFYMKGFCKVTGQEYSIFVIPVPMKENPLMFSDFERSKDAI